MGTPETLYARGTEGGYIGYQVFVAVLERKVTPMHGNARYVKLGRD